MAKVLGLIPARGGSKGILRKNLVPLAGKPLIQYTFDAALAARCLHRRVLTTDDAEIAAVGKAAGVEVPFMRPSHLGEDATPMIDVVLHALAWLEEREGYRPDILVLLQPTAPLRRASHIDAAMERLLASGADALVSVCEVPGHYHPGWQLVVDGEGRLRKATGEPLQALASRRQGLGKTYWRNGALYIAWRRVILETRSLFGENTIAFEMPAEESVNVDAAADLRYLEYLLARRRD